MGRPRSFDWDEAARLYAEHRNYCEVGRLLGVSYQAIRNALHPEVRAYHAQYQRENETHVGPCAECGAPATSRYRPGTLCKECDTRRKATSVRPDTLLCGLCGLWLPDEAYPHRNAARSRRGRHTQCSLCNSAARRDARAVMPAAERQEIRQKDRERKRTARVKAAA